VNQKRFSKEIRDNLISQLCVMGADLDQSVIDNVQRNCLLFYKTYQFLRTRDIIGPAAPPFAVDDTGLYYLQKRDYNRLVDILFGGEIPDSVLELLRECRFEPSSSLLDLFLSSFHFLIPSNYSFSPL
jgi:hypothetical protein